MAKPNHPFEPASVSAVRIAQPEDVEGMMALARLMPAEVGMLPLDAHKVRAAIKEAVSLGLASVCGHPDVRGCMCLQVGEPWYSVTRQINEFIFFVHPDHRRADYARSLLAWGKIGTPGDLLDLGGNAVEYGIGKVAHWLGATPNPGFSDVAAQNRALTKGTDWLPRTQDELQTVHDVAGVDPYRPQTLAGEFVDKAAK